MINELYQKVVINGRNRSVLDFQKIRDKGYLINIVLSERARQGKSFNALEHILDTFLTKGWRSVGIFNTSAQFDETVPRFISNNKNAYPKKWEIVSVNACGLFYGKTQFCYFIGLSTASKYKGNRDYSVKTIIYDEFNISLRMIKNKQPDYFETILHTFFEPTDTETACFLFGNQTTIAIPFLAHYGINRINQELEYINQGNNKLILFYVPVGNLKSLDVEFRNSRLYSFSKKGKLFNKNFANINYSDNMSAVVLVEQKPLFMVSKIDQISIDGKNYICGRSQYGFFYDEIETLDTNLKTGSGKRKDTDDNITYSPFFRFNLADRLAEQRIGFGNYNVKVQLLSVLA